MKGRDIMETWKDIEGYKVSSNGAIVDENGPLEMNKRSGVLCVKMHLDGENRVIKVHRLVASLFIPNPENKPNVYHLNRNKEDNRVENLEWRTTEEVYANAPFRGIPVLQIDRKTGDLIARYNTIKAASEATGVKPGNITRTCKGEQNTSGGYIWKYEGKED